MKCHFLECHVLLDENPIRCINCENIKYCSAKCLRIDRSNHSNDCKSVKLRKFKAIQDRDFYDFDYLKNKYNEDIVLGKGAFSEVKLVKDKINEELFAMKIVNKANLKTQSDIDQLLREIKIHKRLSHPNIIKLHHCFETEEYVYMIQDYAPNTLSDYLQKNKNLNEENAFIIFFQVCLAVHLLHKSKIIHRDIKPENLLFDINRNIKLCDFGWCGKLEETRKTFCGTLDYLAPEIINNTEQSEKTDIWCLGILLYELVMGCPPFFSKNLQEKMQNFRQISIKFNPKIVISNELKNLIILLLSKDPKKRPSISDIFINNWIKVNAEKLEINVENYLNLSKKHSLNFDELEYALEKNDKFHPENSRASKENESKNMKISKTSISVLPSKSSKDSLENETSIMNFLIHPEIKEKLEVSQKRIESSIIIPESTKDQFFMDNKDDPIPEIADIQTQLAQIDVELKLTKQTKDKKRNSSLNLTTAPLWFERSKESPQFQKTLTNKLTSINSTTNVKSSFNDNPEKNFNSQIDLVKDANEGSFEKHAKKKNGSLMNIDKVIQEENYEKYCEKKSKKEKNKDVFKKNKKSTKSCIRISLEKETIKNQQKEIITKKETFNDDKEMSFICRIGVLLGCFTHKK